MFLLSACFGMFDFGMFKYFLLSACCIPHTHLRPGAGLVRGRYDRQGPTALEQRCAAQTWQILFLACRLSSCRSTHTCGQVLVLLVVATTGRAQLRLSRQAGPNCAWATLCSADMTWERYCSCHVVTRSHAWSLCVFATAAGTFPVNFLDGGQARVSQPDNESSSLWPREPELWPNVGRSACRCLWLCRALTGMRSVLVLHSCIDNQLHSCSTLLRPGTGSSMSSSSTSSLTRSIFHTHLCHTHTTTYIHTYSHTYVPSYIHTYVHTYIPTVLPSRSFTTSFVFPFFPVPAKTIEAHFNEEVDLWGYPVL